MMTSKRASRGFTLVELMIVVAVVAILAAIAYPAYTEHVRKTRRAVAAGCMMEMAQLMERGYTTNMSYEGTNPLQADFECGEDLRDFYDIGLVDSSPTEFSLAARPIGPQETDTKCGTLTLNQVGTRTHSGSAASVNDCW
jgi:type IV pilus assembly protein PilE